MSENKQDSLICPKAVARQREVENIEYDCPVCFRDMTEEEVLFLLQEIRSKRKKSWGCFNCSD